MLKVKISLCVVFLLLFTPFLKAQINSPYSRFGIGNLYEGYPIDLAGSGGLTAASEGPTLLNYANPASFGSLQLTTLSFGAYFNDLFVSQYNSPMGNSSDGTSRQGFQDGSLTDLALAFPVVKNHWGASFGLVPYSREGYSIAQINSASLGYNSYDSFDDSGSLYKFYVGNGFQIRLDSFNRINLGVNVAYLFGTFSQSDDLAFSDTMNAYNTQHMEIQTARGFTFQGGIQYLLEFKNGARLVFGAQGNLQTNVPTTVTNTWERFVFQEVGNNDNGIKDTIEGEYNQKGTMVLPASIGGGIVYDNPTHFTIGVNYDYTNWEKFSSSGDSGALPLLNSWRVAVGGQWLPDIKDYHDYFKIIRYSAGFYFEQTYVGINNAEVSTVPLNSTIPIDEYALTLGAALPLTHGPIYTRYSTLNIALELGQRGELKYGLLRERFFTVSLGLTLNDLWFVKRKFD